MSSGGADGDDGVLAPEITGLVILESDKRDK